MVAESATARFRAVVGATVPSGRQSARTQVAERQKIDLQPVTSSFLPPSITLTDLARKLSPVDGLKPRPSPHTPSLFFRSHNTGMPMIDLPLSLPEHSVHVAGAAMFSTIFAARLPFFAV